LVLQVKGVEFVEKWFGAQECVPPNLIRPYQLLLNMVTMKGTAPMRLALKLGFSSKLISKMVSEGLIKVSLMPKKPPKEVRTRIAQIIGKPPDRMVV
jgi:hypothetical protein